MCLITAVFLPPSPYTLAFVCGQHISYDLGFNLEEKLLTEMVIVVQGHQIIFWVTVCAFGLDIRVTLSVFWLNVIFKFARDLLVLFSLSLQVISPFP